MRRQGKAADRKLRERLLEHLEVLRIPIEPPQLDETLARAERDGLSYLELLDLLLGELARLRRERSIERRIRAARLAERKTLEEFDWEFNKKYIDRTQIEQLATSEFVARRDNLIFVGQSGVGKSHLAQAIALRACAHGHSVRYTTSGDLIVDLTSALADRTLPAKLRHYSRPALLVIDEFGFDRLERQETPESASLLYKVVDARHGRGSILLVTNLDFDLWGEYLGDPPLSMALLDRLVYRATIIKIKKGARSYRAASVRGRRERAEGV